MYFLSILLYLWVFKQIKTFTSLHFTSLHFYSNSIPIGSLLDSASESDSKSNELKMSNRPDQESAILNVYDFCIHSSAI